MFDKPVKKMNRQLKTLENEVEDLRYKMDSLESDLESDCRRVMDDCESEMSCIQKDHERQLSELEDNLMGCHMEMEELSEEVQALNSPFRYYYQVYLNRFNLALDRFNQRVDKLLHFGGKA
jgi:predicted  nucleic acid-binding Zn-ribbon protein